VGERTLIFGPGYWSELERLRLVARRVHGVRPWRPRKLGSGVEISDRRPYEEGDEPRYIDWRYFARTRRLVTRLYEAERDLGYLILLDASSSMSPRWVEALRLSHASLFLATCAGDRGRIAVAGKGGVNLLTECRTEAAARATAEQFASLKPEGTINLSKAVSSAFSSSPNTHILLVVTDLWAENWREVFDVLSLAQVRRVVVVLHGALDRGEVGEGELRLVDCEAGESLLLAVEKGVVHDYKAEYRRWRSEVEEVARSRGCEVFFCVEEEGFGAAVEALFSAGLLLP